MMKFGEARNRFACAREAATEGELDAMDALRCDIQAEERARGERVDAIPDKTPKKGAQIEKPPALAGIASKPNSRFLRGSQETARAKPGGTNKNG